MMKNATTSTLVQRPEPGVGCNLDTFAQGHYKDSARQAGFAATKAEVTKCQNYHDLQSNYHFQPVAIETTGVYGKSTAPFLSGLSKKL